MSADDAPWPELARGRSSSVYELADGRVLRRNAGSDAAWEAEVMAHARRHGVRVPTVFEAHGHDLVMERIEGPTLLTELLDHPERLDEHAQVLADLHAALDRVPAPAAAPRLPGDGEPRLVHLDLHPVNVICSPDGPVLLDWTNAMAGPRTVDVATTWLIMACHEAPANLATVIDASRAALVAAFLHRVDLDAARAALPAASRLQLVGPVLGAAERRRISELVESSSG